MRAILGAVLIAVASGWAEERAITILHTNDIHGHVQPWRGWEGELAGKTIGGMDRLATAIQQVRAERGVGNVLLLDAGDTLGDTMIADETEGGAVLQVMNAVAYDAMVIGNHEPDFATTKLRELIGRASFPILAANVRDRASGQLVTKPYVIREIGGVKIGILGLAYPNTALTTAKKNVATVDFLDIPPIARELVPKMRGEGAQIIVALTHYGLSADMKLAQSAPGIDVIVGGHSHNRVTPAIEIGTTLIVQAGAHCSDLGRLDLTVKEGRVTKHESRLISLDHAAIASDPETAKLIESLVAPLKEKLDEPVAIADVLIARAQTLSGARPRKRDEESPADSLFADILREETKADIAALPGVGYGVAIQPGAFTAAALRNLIPHQSKVVTLKLTGAQIREILEQSIENTYTDDPVKKVGGMIQVSGLTLRYDPKGTFGMRIIEAKVNEDALAPERSYLVATNSMLAEGGHNYRTFLDGRDRQELGGQYEMVKAAMHKRGHPATPASGRISK